MLPWRTIAGAIPESAKTRMFSGLVSNFKSAFIGKIKPKGRIVDDRLFSIPIKDQVPLLRYIKSASAAGTATTAEAVSWAATVMTGMGSI